MLNWLKQLFGGTTEIEQVPVKEEVKPQPKKTTAKKPATKKTTTKKATTKKAAESTAPKKRGRPKKTASE